MYGSIFQLINNRFETTSRWEAKENVRIDYHIPDSGFDRSVVRVYRSGCRLRRYREDPVRCPSSTFLSFTGNSQERSCGVAHLLYSHFDLDVMWSGAVQ